MSKTLANVIKICIFVVVLFPAFPYPQLNGSDHANGKINCDIQYSSCTQTISNTTVMLDISPKPVKAMEDLTFQVTVKGDLAVKNPFIELDMPGMNMGPNRVRLKPVGGDLFEGKGIIVRCPSGKTVWRAMINIPGIGTVDFIFDVIY